MIRVNENYQKLKASYLFADIAKRVNAWVAANPDKKLIRMGIGDVTEPLPPACIAAFHAGTPPESSIVLTAGVFYLGSLAFGPRESIAARLVRLRHLEA